MFLIKSGLHDSIRQFYQNLQDMCHCRKISIVVVNHWGGCLQMGSVFVNTVTKWKIISDPFLLVCLLYFIWSNVHLLGDGLSKTSHKSRLGIACFFSVLEGGQTVYFCFLEIAAEGEHHQCVSLLPAWTALCVVCAIWFSLEMQILSLNLTVYRVSLIFWNY